MLSPTHIHTLQLRTKSPGVVPGKSGGFPTRRFAGGTDPNTAKLMMHTGDVPESKYSLKANDQGLFPARDHVYSLKANDPKTQVYSLKGIMFIP